MKVHPIQTGIVRCKQFQLTGASNILSRIYQLAFTDKWGAWMPIYCWLIEHPDGLILVDTGETAQIYEKGYLPAGGMYHKAVQTKIKTEEEIPYQLAKINVQPSDIKTIILTHMHGDHIGGLSHFEHCDIYVSKTEYDLAAGKKGASNGYFKRNWPTWFKPNLITYTDGPEGSFSTSKKLKDDIIIVPTTGHSVGHQSIIIKTKPHTIIIGGDLTYNIDTLKKRIPDLIFMNKVGQQTVNNMYEYTEKEACIYLSSHDWNAPEYLKKGQFVNNINN